MKKMDLLNKLINNISYFNGVSTKDFCLLASLDTSELNTMKPDTYRVTPLLKQMEAYAFVSIAIGEDEKEVLEKSVIEIEDLNKVLDFCECCQQYIVYLVENGCYHPSAINLINSSCAVKSYNVILETLVKLIADNQGEIPVEFKDFYNTVDSCLEELVMDRFEYTLSKITSSENISDKDLLLYLTSYASDITRLLMLFETNKKVYIGEHIIMNVLKNEEVDSEKNFSIGNALNEFATFMKEIEKYLEFGTNHEVKEKVEKIKEGFFLYNSYRYDYLKKDYLEKEMLVRCKKM